MKKLFALLFGVFAMVSVVFGQYDLSNYKPLKSQGPIPSDITKIAVDKDDQIIGYKFVHLGKMMDMIKKGMDANEALAKASGQYGRVDDAARLIDPREE